MIVDPDRTVILAGNGPSITQIPKGTVLAEDFIIRTNSFFFEPHHYIGKRVDLAVIGGDPRVAPFVFETLWRCRQDYDLHRWSSHDPRVQRAGFRRFPSSFQPWEPLTPELNRRVTDLCARYNRKMTTGVQSALQAYAMGAKKLVLVGIDFYSGVLDRYTYAPGRHYRNLMGQDVGNRGADLRLHDPDLDKAVLDLLNSQGDVTLYRSGANQVLDDIMEPAPLRQGTMPTQTPRRPPDDWAAWAGLYPIQLLKFLRKSSALLKRDSNRNAP